jgi:hypothetical protein
VREVHCLKYRVAGRKNLAMAQGFKGRSGKISESRGCDALQGTRREVDIGTVARSHHYGNTTEWSRPKPSVTKSTGQNSLRDRYSVDPIARTLLFNSNT